MTISYRGASYVDIVNLLMTNRVTPRTREGSLFNQRFGDGTEDEKFEYRCAECRANCFKEKKLIVVLGSNDALCKDSEREVGICPMKGVRKLFRMLRDMEVGKTLFNDVPMMKNNQRNPNVAKNARLINRSIYSKLRKGWAKNAGWDLLEFKNEGFNNDQVHLDRSSVGNRIRTSRVV